VILGSLIENLSHGRNVKGAVSGVYDAQPEEGPTADLQFSLEVTLKPGDQPQHLIPTRTHLYIYVSTVSNPTWKDILASFAKTSAELRGARLLRALSRASFYDSLRIAYMGILWPNFSIDLVAAALRQREFARRITGPECEGIDSPGSLMNATSRYHKFLLLMKRSKDKKNKKIPLVPTMDIDLSWHTHQLYAVAYRSWCVQHLGMAVNHDDTVSEEDLNPSFKETVSAWAKAYREPYTNERPPKPAGKLSGLFKSSKGKQCLPII
jgi:Glycine-rich domain-containing protein-like